MFGISNFWSFQVHAGGQHEGKLVGMVNDLLVFLDSLTGKSGGEIGGLIFPGIAQIANFHPLVVHFPIALLVMFFIAESVAFSVKLPVWRTFASGLLYSGTLFAALTVFLGFQAAETVAHDEVVHSIMERHEGYGVAVLSLAVTLSVLRWFFAKRDSMGLQITTLMLAALMNVLLFFGADLGGLMVYHHGVGVNAVMPSLSAYQHEHSGEAGQPATAPAPEAVHVHEDGAAHEHSHAHQHGHEHSH